MGITITTKTLYAPVPHVTLLKPSQTLLAVANSADRDKLFL
jgi:hypothetical protein